MSNTLQSEQKQLAKARILSPDYVNFVWRGQVYAAPRALEQNLRAAGIVIGLPDAAGVACVQ